MNSSTINLAANLPPPAAGSNLKNSTDPSSMVKKAFFPLQVGSKGWEKLQAPETSISLSRRDFGLCLSASSLIAAATFSLPEPAEARVLKPEMKKKIMEKLRMLREKAGLSKPDTDTEENSKSITPTPPSANEKDLPMSPIPNLQDSNRSLVEV